EGGGEAGCETAFSSFLDVSLSSMIRRIEARISSIEGSRCTLLGCAMVIPVPSSTVYPPSLFGLVRIMDRVPNGSGCENPLRKKQLVAHKKCKSPLHIGYETGSFSAGG